MNVIYVFRERTPIGNETPMNIDELLSSDEEGSFVKYKRNEKAVKRKIKDENIDILIEPKKRLLNGEKVPTEENSSRIISDHSYCMPQQVYSPPPIPDWESEIDTTNKLSASQTSQPVISKEKKPEILSKKSKQPLAVRDSNKIDYADQLIAQKHREIHIKVKHFNRRDMMQEATVLFEFLTKGIDVEDINYLKQSYDLLLTNDNVHYWLNETHWVSHPDILLILLLFLIIIITIHLQFINGYVLYWFIFMFL